MVRRLPVYLLLDTSGSMRGEPIESVKVGIDAMVKSLRADPFALESVHLSIITFDSSTRILLPLTELVNLRVPEITTPESGATQLGHALELLFETCSKEISHSGPDQKGDWKPLLFIMTDGKRTDPAKFEEYADRIRHFGFGSIVACAAGPKADMTHLRLITDQLVHLDTSDSSTFTLFFKWVSASVSAGSRSLGSGDENALPPPPPEVHFIL